MFEFSVDVSKFLPYVQELRCNNPKKKIAVFFDNLTVHKSKDVTELMDKLGIKYLYNVPYAPDCNPTESCISVVKNHYKRQKLNFLVNEKPVNSLNLTENL